MVSEHSCIIINTIIVVDYKFITYAVMPQIKYFQYKYKSCSPIICQIRCHNCLFYI